jgi:glutathione peroxidase
MTTALTSLYDVAVDRLGGGSTTLAEYTDQVLLIVNTASACGLTPQYEALEALQCEYGHLGFTVLGFPCNQFGAQEPGTADEIISFCSSRFGVSFPLFAKTEVNGPNTHPLYQWLKQAAPGSDGAADIEWNFAKFLVGRDGQVIGRYAAKMVPQLLAPTIERALDRRV